MLISEVSPIDYRGVNFLNIDGTESLIDRIIELPLRNACKIFARKGIETVMSSANKTNILKPGETRTEKEDVYGNGQELYYPRPTFKDAGKGYVWIMLNFNTLSDENREWLFSLEERKGENGEQIGEKAVWFIEPDAFCIFGHSKAEPNSKFYKKRIILGYNGDLYPRQTVMLRKPVDETTTVDEVDRYFTKLAECFKEQKREEKECSKDKGRFWMIDE